MNNIIELKKKDGSIEKAKVISLDENFIDKIIKLQESIIVNLPCKDWYSASTEEEFKMQIKNGESIGYALSDGSLAAIGIYTEWKYDHDNYGYDLGIKGEELLKVAQVEVVLVHGDFRGNGIQKILCRDFEDLARKRNMRIIAATVHPNNIFSFRNFKSLGYKVKVEKLMYGGLRRFVLYKEI